MGFIVVDLLRDERQTKLMSMADQGAQLIEPGEALGDGPRLADDRHVRLEVEDPRKTRADQLVVVDQHDGDGLAHRGVVTCFSGREGGVLVASGASTTLTDRPPSSGSTIRSSASMRRARSLMMPIP